MEKEWPYEIKKEKKPRNGNLFKIDENSELLSEEVTKLCHRFIMKNMFSCKRGRSDVEISVSFFIWLCQGTDGTRFWKIFKNNKLFGYNYRSRHYARSG